MTDSASLSAIAGKIQVASSLRGTDVPCYKHPGWGGVAQGRLQVASEEGCVKSCAEVTTLGRVQLVGVGDGV